MGIKIGRYHVYLPKMLKPKAVSFRISLWKLYNDISDKNKIPKSGLNFIKGKNLDRKFYFYVVLKNFKTIMLG